MEPTQHLYHYRAKITSVYDGDTVTADMDLGMKTWVFGEKLRLYRINTPEVRGEERPAGLLARDFLRELLAERDVVVETVSDKKGKYGRYLAELWVRDDQGEWLNVNDHLVTMGHAEYRDY